MDEFFTAEYMEQEYGWAFDSDNDRPSTPSQPSSVAIATDRQPGASTADSASARSVVPRLEPRLSGKIPSKSH